MSSRAQGLYEQLIKILTPDTVFACIGAKSSSSYLDSVGPQIGDNLINYGIPFVYGSNKHPFNAITAERKIKHINKKHKNSRVIAIDACSTSNENKYGKIQINNGSIYPGAGVGKKISPIGNYSIKAYVVYSDYKDLLSNSVLYSYKYKDDIISLVDTTVDIITEAIIRAYIEISSYSEFDIFETQNNRQSLYFLM